VKRLHLLRHAKSSWDEPGLDDHDRPLAGRGRRAAEALAGWLEENGVRPELALCSTAVRARQTLELVLAGLGDPVVSYEDGLYLATAGELLQRLRELPDGVGEALVVGHNPGLQDLALELAAPSLARDRIAAKLPTAALVALGADLVRWADLAPEGATVVAFVTPRELS
jgi:phosphohistidine phosphatase